jgi:hypothetical protein
MLLPSCHRGDRQKQLAECVAIYRTAYVTGWVQECLVNARLVV